MQNRIPLSIDLKSVAQKSDIISSTWTPHRTAETRTSRIEMGLIHGKKKRVEESLQKTAAWTHPK